MSCRIGHDFNQGRQIRCSCTQQCWANVVETRDTFRVTSASCCYRSMVNWLKFTGIAMITELGVFSMGLIPENAVVKHDRHDVELHAPRGFQL